MDTLSPKEFPLKMLDKTIKKMKKLLLFLTLMLISMSLFAQNTYKVNIGDSTVMMHRILHNGVPYHLWYNHGWRVYFLSSKKKLNEQDLAYARCHWFVYGHSGRKEMFFTPDGVEGIPADEKVKWRWFTKENRY